MILGCRGTTRVASAVLVSGDELLVESALLEERVGALGDLDPAWALTEIGPGPDFAARLAATATLGLGDEKRVVVIRRAGALDEESFRALLDYLAAQPGHVSLVLEGQGWTSPARSRALSDRVKQVGGTVRREDVPPPSRRADMVREQAARRALRLDGQAARYLAEYLGDEIGNLSGILSQLLAVHGEGARLAEDDVARLFQGSRHGFQWDITDAIWRGDTATALEFVHGAFDHTHPLAVHAALVTHYRRVLLVAGRDLAPGQAAAELGLKDFPARKVVEQARRLGPDGARRAFELLADADVALRGGAVGLDEKGVMDVLIVQLCALTRRR